MSKLQEFCQAKGLDENNVFEISLGQDNPILPGRPFTPFYVCVEEEAVVCYKAKENNTVIKILYEDIAKAEFGIGNQGRLWLQCDILNEFVPFSANNKAGWKSPAAKKLLEKLGERIVPEDRKMYERATGKFSFFYLAWKAFQVA